MSRSDAPWTAEQVVNLADWQRSNVVHPFTCGNDHDGDRVLVPTSGGWCCPSCDYRQGWAHEFMADGSALASQREAFSDVSSREGGR